MVIKDLPKPVLALLNFIIKLIAPCQLLILYPAYWFFALYFLFFGKKNRERAVAVGVTETASMIHFLGEVFPSSYSCVLDANPYCKDTYSFGPYSLVKRTFMGPLLLAYLAHLCDTFVYISFTGYLAKREYDLKFLKARRKKIVVLFCGSDIRSLKKTKEFFDARNEDSWVNYNSNLNNESYDKMIEHTAEITDRYADLVFNWSYDQIGYLKTKTQPWPYMFDVEKYPYEFKAPDDVGDVLVLHCPNNTVIKGTPLVRAAVKKLQSEGYNFKYRELIGVPNRQVIQELGQSHIVLQEFYCITPGTLGIESLSRGNAVLMAADRSINPELPEGSDKAWFATPYFKIYDHLKYLLDNLEIIEQYARNGRQFIEQNYAFPVVREYYQRLFKERKIPF